MATITWTNGSGGSWLTGSNWSSGSVPGSADTAEINQAGTYTIDGAQGTVAAVVLDDPDAVLSLGADGSSTELEVVNGLTDAAAGVVDLAGSETFLSFDNSATIADAQINDTAVYAAIGAGGNLTLAADSTITVAGSSATPLSGDPDELALGADGTLVNAGLIDDTVADGYAVMLGNGTGSDMVVNTGTINVDGPDNALIITAGSFVNAGTVIISGGASLFLNALGELTGDIAEGAYSNTGTIEVTNSTGTLEVGGVVTVAELAEVTMAGGLFELAGTLVNTGSTVTLTPGTTFGNLALGDSTVPEPGVIQGGTVVENGGTVSFPYGMLDGVTWVGTLDLSQPGQTLSLIDGSVLQDPGGGAETITLTGAGSSLSFDGGTLSDTTIHIGAAGDVVSLFAPYADGADPPPVLTLDGQSQLLADTNGAGTIIIAGDIANQGLINLSDGDVQLGAFSSAGTDTAVFDNTGTLIAQAGLGETLTVGDLTTFDNEGLIQIENGEEMDVDGPGIVDAGTLSVTGDSLVQIADQMQIGAESDGPGMLLIRSHSTVSVGDSSGGVAADIAATAGTDGSEASVTDWSVWNVTGSLVVGDAAAGGLTIANGGTVTADLLTLGQQTGSAGNLSVSGAGSELSVSGDLQVGAGAVGDLEINNGATVNAGTLDIGTGAGSSGVLDLEGAYSVLNVAGDQNIGPGGLMVMGDGTLSIGGNQNIAGQFFQTGGIVDPATATVAAGHALGGAGGAYSVGTLTVAGTIYAQNGTYTFNGGTYASEATIIGTGSIQASQSGNLVLDASVGSGLTVDFLGDNSGTITIGDLLHFTPKQINDFVDGDRLQITGGISGTTLSDHYTANTGVLTLIDGSGNNYAVDFTPGTSIQAIDDGIYAPGGQVVPCFAAGTRIATPTGPVVVEALREGDIVTTRLRGELQPVTWIGYLPINCRKHPNPRDVWPVRIAAGTFGVGQPHCDLWLSPDHAISFEGVLIPVRYLVNGSTIAQVEVDEVTYYHVEVPRHDLLLAEGLAVESFLDTGGKPMFANVIGLISLQPESAIEVWEAEGCAPLVVTGPPVARARRLAEAGVMATAA